MKWLLDVWSSLSRDLQEKILVAAVSSGLTAVLGLFIPRVIWPILVRTIIALRELLFNRVAGLPIFNRWALLRYKRSLLRELETFRNPWSNQNPKIGNILVPIRVQKDYTLPHIVPGETPSGELFDLSSVVTEYRRFVLVGTPGAGKSTALRSLGCAALNGYFPGVNNRLLPIYVELRRFAEADKDIFDYILKRFDENGFPNASNVLDRFLKRGEALLLLDGLDEVASSAFNHAIDTIRHFCRVFPENQVILTCRTAAYDRQLDDVSHATVLLSDFNDIQIAAFTRHWDYPPEKSSVALLKSLNDKPRILGICRNPLMLTIVTALYIDTDYALPHSRVQFYLTCIEAVLKRWDVSRQIDRKNRFGATLKSRLLERLALDMQTRDALRGEIGLSQLIEFLSAQLPSLGRDASEAELIIKEIVVNSGLLCFVEPEKLRMPHLTFQEFLSARELIRIQAEDQLLTWFAQDPTRWREVCLLYCGLSGKNERFVQIIAATDLCMAAACVADSDTFDSTVVAQLLNRLCESASNESQEGKNTCLHAISLLASDSVRPWARSAFEALLHNFRSATSEQHKIAAISALANVPTEEAADVLIEALRNVETAPAAKQALESLGTVAIGPLKRVMDGAGDEALEITCLELCSTMLSPAVVELLLPRIFKRGDRVSTAASIAFGILMQNPLIESVLYTINASDLDGFGFRSEVGFAELQRWVWPFPCPPDSPMVTIIAVVVDRLSSDWLHELLLKGTWREPLDVRVAIPASIRVLEKSRDDEKSRERLPMIIQSLFRDSESWERASEATTLTLRSEPVSPVEICGMEVGFLRESWREVLRDSSESRFARLSCSRNIARMISGLLMTSIAVLLIMRVTAPANDFRHTIVGAMTIFCIGYVLLSYSWHRITGESFWTQFLNLPVAGGSYLRDLVVVGKSQGLGVMLVVLASLLIVISVPLFLAGLGSVYGSWSGVLSGAVALLFGGNFIFALDGGRQTRANPWRPFLTRYRQEEQAEQGTADDTHLSLSTGIRTIGEESRSFVGGVVIAKERHAKAVALPRDKELGGRVKRFYRGTAALIKWFDADIR